ncbi:MAG: GNAT family N-acetyltransferase [Bradymonadia bacterium]
MDVKLHDCLTGFSNAALPWMLKQETLHCKVFAGMQHLGGDPGRLKDATLVTIHDAGKCVGTAVRTRPSATLFVGPMTPSAVPILSSKLHASDTTISRLQGPQDVVDRFAREWSSLTSTSMNVELNQGCYECVNVIPPQQAKGQMLKATANHLEPAAHLLEAFVREIDGTTRDISSEVLVRTKRFIDNGYAYLWMSDGGEYVASTIQVRESPNGASLSLVYTPPAHRGNGYASNLVAQVTQCLFDEGKRLVNLFTDRSNRQSNAIYQRIGYRQISDCRVYAQSQ